MKTILSVIAIAIVLFLSSCKEDKLQSQNGQPQKREIKRLPQSEPPTKKELEAHSPAPVANNGIVTAVVTEVLNVEGYTYLKVKEGTSEYWMAIQKRPMLAGDTISFEKQNEMRNFTSKQLNRTFESIYFISGIKKISSGPDGKETAPPSDKTVVEKKPDENISVGPAKSGITIVEIFENRKSYSGKVVRVKGKVTKFNKEILGKNWVHLQDGTGKAGTNDLTVTTQETVNVGDVVEFEGTITLNKDFGHGYKYEVLMEKGMKK